MAPFEVSVTHGINADDRIERAARLGHNLTTFTVGRRPGAEHGAETLEVDHSAAQERPAVSRLQPKVLESIYNPKAARSPQDMVIHAGLRQKRYQPYTAGHAMPSADNFTANTLDRRKIPGKDETAQMHAQQLDITSTGLPRLDKSDATPTRRPKLSQRYNAIETISPTSLFVQRAPNNLMRGDGVLKLVYEDGRVTATYEVNGEKAGEGHVSFSPISGGMWGQDYITAEPQRSGIGSALVYCGLVHAQEEGVDRIAISMANQNSAPLLRMLGSREATSKELSSIFRAYGLDVESPTGGTETGCWAGIKACFAAVMGALSGQGGEEATPLLAENASIRQNTYRIIEVKSATLERARKAMGGKGWKVS